MSKTIYLSGNARTGKTAIAMGLGLKLQQKGHKVSYFKPLGYHKNPLKREDNDVVLMKEILRLPFTYEQMCPVTLGDHYLNPGFLKNNLILSRLEQAFNTCREGSDVVIVDGGMAPFVGFCRNLDDLSLAQRWNAALLFITKVDKDLQFDESLMYLKISRKHDLHLLGCILNNISRSQWDKSISVYKPLIEQAGVPVLGTVPRRVEISAPTVMEFYELLQGEILAAENQMDRLVEEVVVGTMTLESALRYLRRAPNKALITGGDRSDLALTALETSTSVIIFTGGLYPEVQVLSRAEDKGVPVILVHQDTFTTVENLHGIYRSIDPRNKEAIRIVKENIEKHVNWQALLEYITGQI
jgi:BioD-like phosphotransacetylase family protein